MVGRWVSVDPAIEKFIPKKKMEKLPSDGIFKSSNLGMYIFTSNNPLKRVDPEGQYDIDVHYYLTYYLAMKAGCSDKDSLELATYNQFTDDDPRTSPITLNETIRRKYHFADDKRLTEMKKEAISGNKRIQSIHM